MSWPNVKPPWKHVNWLSWEDSIWPSPPMLEYNTGPRIKSAQTELDILKLKIEELDKTGEWEFLKRSSNPYELVFSQSQDSRIPSSICSLRPLSRSFFKMVEILSVLDFFKRHTKKPIRTSHVCEGPGGFIEALLYVATKNSTSIENAWAMTLKPTRTNIPGWKRAYHFLRKSPMVHIDYGADDTGDIMVPVNQLAFLEKTRGKCNIFTADGGFDFSEHYSTQEEEVFPLLISSALIGLQTIIKGGDFVLKVFDTELSSTRNLLALLASCFDSWTLYKPALSRPCNAEKYFLGRGCKQVPPWVINLLAAASNSYYKGNPSIQSFFNSIPGAIEADMNNLQKEYLDQQIAALNYAFLMKDEWNAHPQVIWKTIKDNSMQWCREFKIPTKAPPAEKWSEV